jgi:hypothetical protein
LGRAEDEGIGVTGADTGVEIAGGKSGPPLFSWSMIELSTEGPPSGALASAWHPARKIAKVSVAANSVVEGMGVFLYV